jgi:3D (Asp-Asp-Asp) domain-containing protein
MTKQTTNPLVLSCRRFLIAFCASVSVGAVALAAVAASEPRKVTDPITEPSQPSLLAQSSVELLVPIAPTTPTAATAKPAIAQTMIATPTIANTHVIWMEVTAYCSCPKCCGVGAMGLTASGKPVTYNNGKFVAADTKVLPMGSKILVNGYDAQPVEVIDRGGAIKGNKLDVFFPTHEEARQWGRRWIAVSVVQ